MMTLQRGMLLVASPPQAQNKTASDLKMGQSTGTLCLHCQSCGDLLCVIAAELIAPVVAMS